MTADSSLSQGLRAASGGFRLAFGSPSVPAGSRRSQVARVISVPVHVTTAGRKLTKKLLLLLLFLLCLSPQPSPAFDQSHELFAKDLRRFVEGNLVHYKLWQKESENLRRYLKSLSDLSKADLAAMSEPEREALWLNAYNAFTIKLVLDHYPIHGTNPYFPKNSLRQIPDVWEKYSTTIAGEPYTIDSMEHDILRLQFHDSRIHYAVNAAARGSGALPATPFQAATLDRQLAFCAEQFLSDKDNLSVDPKAKIVKVSQIFKWFPLDFTKAAGMCKRKLPPPTDDEIVVAYTESHLPAQLKEQLAAGAPLSQFKVVYRPFDWSLNDADYEPPK